MGQNSKNAPHLILLRSVLAVAVLVLSFPAAHAADEMTNATIEALMNSGLAHRDAGEFPAAEEDFRKIVEAAPENGDARLLLALVIGYQNRFDEALSVLEPAIQSDPMRDDLLLTRARLNAWAGRFPKARTDLETVLARTPNDAAALELSAWLKQAEAKDGGRYVISLNRERSDFKRRDVDEWYETRLGVAYRSGEDWNIDGAFQDSRRYGKTDRLVELGGNHTVNDQLSVSLRGETSPGADFLPRWGVSGGLELSAWDGAADLGLGAGLATLNARHRKYTNVGVDNLDPGWIQYFGDGSAWLTLRRTHTWSDDGDGTQTGWSVRGDWALDEFAPLNIYALRSKSPETDQGVTTDTWTWASGAVLRATDSIDLRLDYTRENRSGSYIRNVWSLGAAVTF